LGKVLDEIIPGEVEKRGVRMSQKYRFMYFLLMTGRFFYIKNLFLKLPKFKKTVWMFEKWMLENVGQLRKGYKPFLDRFYSEKKISEKIKNHKLWDELGLTGK
ncbi:MAG: hypothetical protein ACP5E3_20765, partial [Bacteroidales bacterium]